MTRHRVQALLLQLYDPRKTALLFSLLLFALTLSGCGDVSPACPSGSSGSSCGGGGTM